MVRLRIRNSQRNVAVHIDDYDDIVPIRLLCIIRGIGMARDRESAGIGGETGTERRSRAVVEKDGRGKNSRVGDGGWREEGWK